MIQLISGLIILAVGAWLLISGVRRTQQESAGEQKGFIGRFGTLMLGAVLAFLGVALLLPARDATPNPGIATNPVDEAVQDLGDDTGEGNAQPGN